MLCWYYNAFLINYSKQAFAKTTLTDSTPAVSNDASNSNSPSHRIYAIVSRGGRPDLADSDALKNLKASTLLIVGEKDSKETIELNRKALQQPTNSRSKD
ncbi:MAG: hypothetical protein M3M88_06655, partial [Thermoproteota archaeon]|nr:hypothetical protein [Thermoproteota archaeon]